VTVELPSKDKRLVKWDSWLREHRPDILEGLLSNWSHPAMPPQIDDTYCYVGRIPKKAIRAITQFTAPPSAHREVTMTCRYFGKGYELTAAG
jgi:hypothetical protein